MKHTFKYTINFCFVFLCLFLNAQETSSKKIIPVTKKPTTDTLKATKKEVKKQPTIIPNTILNTKAPIENKIADTTQTAIKTDRYGLRIGIDAYRFTRGFYDKNYKGIEFVGDYRYNKRYFLAAELGFENQKTEDVRLTYTTQGTYLKAGFDYNAYDNWLDMENMLTIGMRYGFSTFNQELNNYRIYNTSQYFGETNPITVDKKYNLLTASWIEIVAGIKAKVFNNVFMGFSLRLNTLITNQKPNDFDNFYIPGFNKTYDGSFGVGFNYTVTYFIPFFKKKIAPNSTKIETKPIINSKK